MTLKKNVWDIRLESRQTPKQFILFNAFGWNRENMLVTVLCTYQRPSRGVDPGEPPGICTKTFANATYPGPIFFHKKLPLSLPRVA